MRRLVAPAGAVVTLAPAAAALAQERWDGGWGMHPMGWMWGLGGIVAMLMMFVFWGAVIAALVVGIRWLAGQGREPRGGDRALEILRERYARGEINREEFEARKRDLGG